MSKIITLTLNPVVDKNTNATGFWPNAMIKGTSPIYYAGGGGINVSRAIDNLGGTSTAIYLAGGRTGEHLEQLLNKTGISQLKVSIRKATRENLTVTDAASSYKYHFGLPGPTITKKEWKQVLQLLDYHVNKGDYLVASGKLPAGIPDNYYTIIAEIAKNKEARFILDTKGAALLHAIKSELFLIKPNLSELSYLNGVQEITYAQLNTIVEQFLKNHPCKNIVVSLGARGALLGTKDFLQYIQAPVVQEKNRIGAGDSMVAGMILAHQKGMTTTEMVQYGVACGSAATINSGAQLCNRKDVDSIYNWIKANTKSL